MKKFLSSLLRSSNSKSKDTLEIWQLRVREIEIRLRLWRLESQFSESSDKKKLQEDLAQTRQKLQDCLVALRQLIVACSTLKQQNATLRADSKVAEEENSSLREQNVELQAENTSLRETIEAELHKVETELLGHYTQQIRTLKLENQALRDFNSACQCSKDPANLSERADRAAIDLTGPPLGIAVDELKSANPTCLRLGIDVDELKNANSTCSRLGIAVDELKSAVQEKLKDYLEVYDYAQEQRSSTAMSRSTRDISSSSLQIFIAEPTCLHEELQNILPERPKDQLTRLKEQNLYLRDKNKALRHLYENLARKFESLVQKKRKYKENCKNFKTIAESINKGDEETFGGNAKVKKIMR